MLPFVAICAASAPLLGLLGTVTGIINTFKLITIFGSGDVKTLSAGISEALITTKFGLIVAIPSLLLHAFLSRKAKSVVDRMEKAAVAFVNAVGQRGSGPTLTPAPHTGGQVTNPIAEALGALEDSLQGENRSAIEAALAGVEESTRAVEQRLRDDRLAEVGAEPSGAR